jgi:hypothetical protein
MTPEWAAEAGEAATFIVWLTRRARGGLAALVERVRTGEKVRVERVEHLGRVLLRMLAGPAHERTEPGASPEPSSPGAEAPGNAREIDR